MDKYIGFDIDSKKVVACVVQEGKNDKYYQLMADIESMRKFLLQQRQGRGRSHLVYEISGEAGYIYDALEGYAYSITVANPNQMTWIYRTAKKNDRIDARKMAVLLSIGEIPAVYMPTKEVRQWRQTILHRRGLVNRMVAVKNRIRALLKSQGYKKAQYTGGWWKHLNRGWMQDLAAVAGGGLGFWRLQLSDLLLELGLLEDQLATVTRRLDNYLVRQPGGTLLRSIPGVGPRTAEAVLAYTDDIHRFRDGKSYGSYFGLAPKLDESGGSRRLGHISKRGPSVVRWLLCESSWRTIAQSPALRAFYERVCAGQKSRRKIANVAVARKLLLIMRSMLLTGELFNESLVKGALCKPKAA
jgi:transposase